MWTCILVCLMTVGILTANTYLIREDTTRSSTIRTTVNYILDGYTFHKRKSTSILDCAHLCLTEYRCLSFNFHYTPDEAVNCHLNNRRAQSVQKWLFLEYEGWTYGELQNMTMPVLEFTFTSLGAIGHKGPTSTLGYNSTNLQDSVRLESGKQQWTVPRTADYIIEGYGASGADGRCLTDSPVLCHKGGLGAKITGTFHLTKGTILTFLVGQKGSVDLTFDFAGGGGGGTFVINNNDSTVLTVAGGGGGGGKPGANYHDGDPGQAGDNGTRCGGADGMGGRLCSSDGSQVWCSSGAGYRDDGNVQQFIKALSYVHGGTGGKAITSDLAVGGFGGGGYAMDQPGGGGGYSGGGYVGNKTSGIAGGGGSYNSGSSQENESGIHKGDGKVIIKAV